MKKKKKLLVASLLSIAATGAMAQSKSFEGFSVGINGSFVGNSADLSFPGDSSSFGNSNLVPAVDVGYTFAVTEKFTLGISGTYDLTESNVGKLSNDFQLKSKNHYSINLKPGYALSKEALVYALVGYNSSEGSITNFSGSTTFTGIGYGVGAQVMFTPNIYGKVEIQQVQYDSKTVLGGLLNVKPISNIGTIGVGYKF